jgi:hypothetical protein
MKDEMPEHTKRGGNNDDITLNSEISAAYDYVHSVLDTSDYKGSYLWHGWALREAFLAGISYAGEQSNYEK